MPLVLQNLNNVLSSIVQMEPTTTIVTSLLQATLARRCGSPR
jgi:hypothetical protein